MDWNTYFAASGNQAYNFVPSEFPTGNPSVYQNGTENWQYYAYNQNFVPESTVQQMVHSVPRPAAPYGAVFTQPPIANVDHTPAVYPLNSLTSENYNVCDDSMAIASMSSLTATAGEFIPRSKKPDLSVSKDAVENDSGKTITDSQQISKSASKSDNNEISKQPIKKYNNAESRYFTSKNSSQVPDSGSKKNGKNSQSNSNQNSRASSVEDSKNQDRQRLLAQAASFYTSSASENGNPDTGNSHSGQRQSDSQFSKDSFGNRNRETSYRGRNQHNHGSGRSELKQKTFVNSRYSGRGYDQSTSSRGFPPQSDNTAFNSRGRKYTANQPSEMLPESESYDQFSSKSEGNSESSNFGSGVRHSKTDNSASSNYRSGSRHSQYDSNSGSSNFGNSARSSQFDGNNGPSNFGSGFRYNKFDGNAGSSNFASGTKYTKDRSNFSPRGSDTKSNFATNTAGAPARGRYCAGDGVKSGAEDEASQRERLSEQLLRGALECLVCCERVRQHDATWSCSNCYHVLHLRCVKKWAKSSKAEGGWHCPACRNVSTQVPQEYRCFCGQMRDPEWNRQDVPHSCGEMCGRSRQRAPTLHPCVHRCTLLCHPGPCPPCEVRVSRSCGCGKITQIVTCGTGQPLLCGGTCGKELNCGMHTCEQPCHMGPCADCQQVVKQECFCGKATKEVVCDAESCHVRHFGCEAVCGRDLSCGHHACALLCHEGPCPPCELAPDRVTHCPCGQTPLDPSAPRVSCLDPVPPCELPCQKRLSCGQPGNNHLCQSQCHVGPCPPCPKTTFIKCRCGHMDKEVECVELTTKADDARCEKRCTKKRSCGRHKCNQTCCIDVDHVCPLPCNHTLSCGQHRCEELCHRGHCQPCYRTSFEELFCECGANVIYPPVPCGTRRPACDRPCSRPHPCEHEAIHPCHSSPQCPPCTVLMQRYCYGKHELRKAVPCHQTEFSCGMPCGRPLSCGRHSCILPCHNGDCLKPGQTCSQPCKTMRSLCGHPCAAPCHEGPCPDTPCKETVRVTCECGHRSTTRPCCDQAKEYQRVITALLASKMHDMQLGHSVDIGDLGGGAPARSLSLKTLDCNDECKIIERNRRLNIGLQIRNPDLSGKLQPRYSEYMRQWAKRDPFFVNSVHEKLTELVQLAKQSKQKSRSYSFSSMNREKRHFIHEYCEHFGCESQAYDPEPNRNVVATAQRDKAWLPSMSLLEVLQRESGQRKVPKPVTARAVDTMIKESPLPLRSQPQSLPRPKKEEEKETPEIDYFEMTS